MQSFRCNENRRYVIVGVYHRTLAGLLLCDHSWQRVYKEPRVVPSDTYCGLSVQGQVSDLRWEVLTIRKRVDFKILGDG